MERLDPRVRARWAVGSLATALAVGAIAAVALQFWAPDWLPAAGGLAGTLGAVGLVLSALRYRRWRYELQADALYLERGVVTRVRTAVPFVRVQHVDTRQGPIERALGLSRVVVYTAGSRGADVTVPGLSPERADALQGRLRELAVESEPEDAV